MNEWLYRIVIWGKRTLGDAQAHNRFETINAREQADGSTTSVANYTTLTDAIISLTTFFSFVLLCA